MANEVERLEKRMVELNNDLQNKKTNPDFAFENIKSVDMLQIGRASCRERV